MEALRLAIELLDRVETAEKHDQPLLVSREAKRLVRAHPEAELSEDEVAEVLREEINALRVLDNSW